MKKPEKKLKKIHSLRHQITAYFIGLLFLSILTITVINGAFLEKYYVTKKIDVLALKNGISRIFCRNGVDML